MGNPNEIWEDSHVRRNVSLTQKLSDAADLRIAELEWIDNFSEYVRKLIYMDKMYNILDLNVLAKLEAHIKGKTQEQDAPFWRKKIFDKE